MQSSLVFTLDPDVVRAQLCDTVEDNYRLLATSEVAGWAQNGLELTQVAATAVSELEKTTGRTLFARGRPAVPEASDGSGISAVYAVAAPRGNLRVAVVGAEKELAFDSGPRLVEGAGHECCYELSLERRSLRAKDVLFDAVRLLWASQPDVVLIAASASGRNEEELGAFAVALGAVGRVPGPELPAVLFAGSETQEAAFRHSLGVGLTVQRIGALRPSSEEERLEEGRAALSNLHTARWLAMVPAYKRFSSWLATPAVPRDLALGRSFRYLSSSHGGAVYGVDLDRQSVGVFLAAPNLYASHRPRVKAPWDRLAKWAATTTDGRVAEQSVGGLLLRPAAEPASSTEALFERAWLRDLVRDALDQPQGSLPDFPPLAAVAHVIGTGRGCNSAFTGVDAAMLLLDALQPTGIGYLRWDAEDLLAAAGALATVQPRLAAELVEEAPSRLAAYVAPAGPLRGQTAAIEVEVSYGDRSGFKVEVAGGTLESVPVVRGERALLDVRSPNNLDVGGGWGKKAKVELEDTSLGIILDARGRPIVWPEAQPARQSASEGWRRAIDTGEPVEVFE